MKFLAALFGAAAPATAAPVPPPAIVAAPPPEFLAPQTVAETVEVQAFGGEFPALELGAVQDGLRGTLALPQAHPAEAVLDQMAQAFQAGLVLHPQNPRAAMADALLVLRGAPLRTPEFTGPGKRRASAKSERRFFSVLDVLILNGTGEPTGWRTPDGRPFA